MNFMIASDLRILPSDVPYLLDMAAADVARDLDLTCVLTSTWRPGGKPSIHRFNCARDHSWLTQKGLPVPQEMHAPIIDGLKARLPKKFFDVVNELVTENHTHCEYDPK